MAFNMNHLECNLSQISPYVCLITARLALLDTTLNCICVQQRGSWRKRKQYRATSNTVFISQVCSMHGMALCWAVNLDSISAVHLPPTAAHGSSPKHQTGSGQIILTVPLENVTRVVLVLCLFVLLSPQYLCIVCEIICGYTESGLHSVL
ncbi:hypothetical protein FQN60_012607 [Etheostoma spectabile]|uniref:Uncharacterized protein n=1 Tax=Etheostoma spectabile TaxID=54343 RepID=A0A5J5D3E8_9PERO|nr:hypothetical protein FQN60_012607 [Etheostoma spectabile]